jgi:transposase
MRPSSVSAWQSRRASIRTDDPGPSSLLRRWREQFLAAGAERLHGKAARTETDELRRQVSRLERALGRKTLEVEVAGELLRGWE